MAGPLLEFGEVRFSLAAGAADAGRAGRIGRLTFEYLRELLGRELQNLSADVEIGSLAVGPVEVSLDAMTDEEVARRSAAEIGRALLHALGR
ncbi:MAG TPA: hypothetical protein VF611_18225 [Pyrinomonadaceae bacterium]|jgi:hypothetical protein